MHTQRLQMGTKTHLSHRLYGQGRELERMKANSILEEVWRVKDQLAAESGYDVDRFFAQLRAWSEAHPHAGPVVRNAALRCALRCPSG